MKFIVVRQDANDMVVPDAAEDQQYNNLVDAFEALAVEDPETEVDDHKGLEGYVAEGEGDVFLTYGTGNLTVQWDASREACAKRWSP